MGTKTGNTRKKLNSCRIGSSQSNLIFEEHQGGTRSHSLVLGLSLPKNTNNKHRCPLLKSRIPENSKEMYYQQQKPSQQQTCFKPTTIKRTRFRRESSRQGLTNTHACMPAKRNPSTTQPRARDFPGWQDLGSHFSYSKAMEHRYVCSWGTLSPQGATCSSQVLV